MRRWIILILALGSLAACGSATEEIAEGALEAGGSGDANVELDLDDEGQGEFVIETDDATQRVDFGASEIPEALEVPLPDGYEIVASSEIESGDERIISVAVQYAGGDIDSIIAHFDDYFESDSETAKSETECATSAVVRGQPKGHRRCHRTGRRGLRRGERRPTRLIRTAVSRSSPPVGALGGFVFR